MATYTFTTTQEQEDQIAASMANNNAYPPIINGASQIFTTNAAYMQFVMTMAMQSWGDQFNVTS